MTKRKLTIPRSKLNKLAKALGGRGAIAEAIGMSRPAVDRYFIGKGMQAETFEKLQALIAEHATSKGRGDLVPEPPTLAEKGGHLYQLLVKALQSNSDISALQSQLNRIERRLDRIEANQAQTMHAWAMQPEHPADSRIAEPF